MSQIDLGEQAERDWEAWLDENQYEHRVGELYECVGGHIWHVSDLEKLYNEEKDKTRFKPSYEVRMIPGEEWRIPKDLLWPSTPTQIKALEAKVKAQAEFTGGAPVKGFEIIPIQTAKRGAI